MGRPQGRQYPLRHGSNRDHGSNPAVMGSTGEPSGDCPATVTAPAGFDRISLYRRLQSKIVRFYGRALPLSRGHLMSGRRGNSVSGSGPIFASQYDNGRSRPW